MSNSPLARLVADDDQPHHTNSMRRSAGLLICAWSITLALLSFGWLEASLVRNFRGILFSRALAGLKLSPEFERQISAETLPLDAAYCLGILASRQDDWVSAEQYWRKAIEGDARYIDLVRAHLGDNFELARLSATRYPERAGGWEWLGDSTVGADAAQALAYYRTAVERDPGANLVWEKIAALAEKRSQLVLALTAYGRACEINPARNGSCLSAARLSYSIGDWGAVIAYFERGGYPESATGWVQLIRAAQHLGREQAASEYLRQAQAERPADYAALLAVP